ncbi:MAG: sugar ABC transporter ATP-binding protein [Lachnospiraceae bacterium]|jgi:ABC-type sugar transport system ATPase subunit|nr:sugar ABC transporter ATP-binding protein [Lachnospiraceae bacterium]
MEIAFELRDITKLFAGTVALEHVSISVNRGEVHGLIGKNGAGKSTLVNILSGIIGPSMGEIHVNGHVFRHLTPHLAKKHKISIITQEPQTMNECTVAENLYMPMYGGAKGWIDWGKIENDTRETLEKAGFSIDPKQKARDLTVSEKQLMLVIKACYVEDADVVIMDEVSASLSKRDEHVLYDIIKERAAAGKTIIFISHHTAELLKVCDRVSVLRNGRCVGCYRCDELDMEKLARLIVGTESFSVSEAADKRHMVSDEVIFRLDGYTRYGKFRDVTLELHRGEILGLAGLRGSGRTEIMKCVVGADRPDGGKVMVGGSEKRYASPSQSLSDGVLYLPEEREREGLIGISSIKKNITISIMDMLSHWGIIKSKKENQRAGELISLLRIKAFSPDQEIHQLSGGNKQKVLVGKIMARTPVVSLLDEPTRGVDIQAKESILHSINEGMREGGGVLITSPSVDDLIKICDRILVLFEGEIIDVFDRGEFSEQAIYQAMQGERIHGAGECA